MEKYSAFFFNLIGQFIFTDFYARGLKRKLKLFLSASFFSFVFSSASKNTPNGNRPLRVKQEQTSFSLFETHDYSGRFSFVEKTMSREKACTKPYRKKKLKFCAGWYSLEKAKSTNAIHYS